MSIRCWLGFHKWEVWPHTSIRFIKKPLTILMSGVKSSIPEYGVAFMRNNCERCNFANVQVYQPVDYLYWESKDD